MKKILCTALCLLFALGAFAGCAQDTGATTTAAVTTAAPPANPVLRCSTTTSVNDSGLMGYLEPLFEAQTGYDLQITSNGSGAAIELGRTGDTDVLLVHAKSSEEEFIAEGYGVERIPFMYNFFIIAGPKDDPAKVADSATAADAFKKIAESKSIFISRGDDSGTHKAELKIWEAAGIAPDASKDDWYISSGAKMGACLEMASQKQGYVLTDKATYLAYKADLDLDIVLGESDDMKNTYSLIACDPDKNTGLNTEGAQAFIDWMTSDATLALIAEFGKVDYGEALFFTDM